MKFLIDECLSPALAKVAKDKDHGGNEPRRLDGFGRPQGLGTNADHPWR